MDIYLVDGTYELFRHYYAVPSSRDSQGREVAAVRGVLASLLSMLEAGTSHIGVATDHVVESFRNGLYPGYKTSEGVPPDLLSQFPMVEEALQAMGVRVWPMVYFEADDALASAAVRAAQEPQVEKIYICTPDKDLGQCVSGTKIVQLDRMRNVVRDEAAIVEKFGVPPRSIPDYLAVVGDSADGYPGIQGWGAKSAALVFTQYPHLEDIPKAWEHWSPTIRRARGLAETLFDAWDDAMLFRTLATLRTDVPVFQNIDELRWEGPRADFSNYCEQLKAPNLPARALAARAKLVSANAEQLHLNR